MEDKVLLIINPCAGKGKINKYIPNICDNLEKQGYELEIIYTTKECNGKEIIKKYEKVINTVIVCGGDGTLNEVINGVIESKKNINVSFIPFGTTNDFSKTVKMPKSKLKISKRFSKFKKQKVDVGKFNNSYFYYVAAFGSFTDISYSTSQEEKNKFGRLAYFKEAYKKLKRFRHMKRFDEYTATVEADGKIIKDQFIYGSISNSVSVAGYKWFYRDDVFLNDGLFEVILIKKPQNFKNVLKIMFSILINKYDQTNIFYLKSKQVKINFEQSVTWTLDGEKGEATKDVSIENLKNNLSMVIP